MVTADHYMCYKIYYIILSTVTSNKLGTCTPWRWHIHAKTCWSKVCNVVCIWYCVFKWL